MTENLWMYGRDAASMVAFVADKTTERKMRLFVVACARLVWDQIPEGDLRDAVDAAERYADGTASLEEAEQYRGRVLAMTNRGTTPEQREFVQGATAIYSVVYSALYGPVLMKSLHRAASWGMFFNQFAVRLPPLLRDILGNPFRPVSADPAWLTSPVVDLARTMYGSRDFAAMPILADALEEAGCDDADVLAHCRGGGPHVRGCWVVDLLLGRG